MECCRVQGSVLGGMEGLGSMVLRSKVSRACAGWVS